MTGDEVMKLLEKTIGIKMDMDTEGQWDSLDQVTILQKFDDVFEGKVDNLPEQELATMTTPRKIIDLLRKHKLIS